MNPDSSAVVVNGLSKTFKIPKRNPGFMGALAALIRRHYTMVEAVRDLSFTIPGGGLVGFLGPNGAGKTTTLKMISGLLHPDAGLVRTLGFVPRERPYEFLRQITLVIGNRSQLWWELPIEESLLLNKEIYELSDDFYKESLGELVELLELSELLNVPAKKLSLGQRMKAELAAALLHRPKLLLLDEPTLGLDVVMQNKIRGFLQEYNQRRGATILLTSHNMEDIAQLCRRVLIIDQGRLLYDGPLKKLVDQYAPTKKIRVDFAQAPAPGSLQDSGLTAINGSGLAAEVNVARERVSASAAELLERSGKTLPAISDITIEEPAVEDVIRTIFAGAKPAAKEG
ncbi:MAG: ATP-binding cassette domain-containing protein [Elusimicrobia bacterium]|nr:ATP-binding cassette domain-containing protein [Elusimicrobiota bacterium]